MAFLDQLAVAKFGIGIAGTRAGLQLAIVDTQAHGAAHVGDVALVGHQVDDWIFGAHVKLGAVGLIRLQNVAGKVDAHHLHAQAQPKVWHRVLTCIVGGADLAFDPAIAKAAGHDNAVHRRPGDRTRGPFPALRS